MHKFLLVIFVMFSSVSLALGDAPYKWVDERGQVHYTDKPPNGPCEEIKIPDCPSEKDVQIMQERLERQKQLIKEYDEKRGKKRKQAELVKKKRKIRAQQCKEAKKKLRYLEESKGLRMAHEGPEGELRWMSDAERIELENHWRKQVQLLCK